MGVHVLHSTCMFTYQCIHTRRMQGINCGVIGWPRSAAYKFDGGGA